MFKKHDKYIKGILNAKEPGVDIAQVTNKHKEMIQIIQHERLIHLLVTIFVGLAFCIFCVAALITQNFLLGLLDLILMILFMGYIFHYRFLENTTQSWYRLSEELSKKI